MKPTVLVAATDRWFPTARLAMALAQAGFSVEAVCPSGHPMTKTRAVRKIRRYHGLRPLASFARAIENAAPDVIVPADDLATGHLHELHRRKGRFLRELIERSLGAAQHFRTVRNRADFIRLADKQGIRAPWTQAISCTRELQDWIGAGGFPMVLKANGTSGGDGVIIANSLDESQRAVNKLSAPPSLTRSVKRTLLDRDSTLLWPSLLRRRCVVNAQQFVRGYDATSTVVCWQGAVLASLHFEVVCKAAPNGHATVIRAIENREMAVASERVVSKLQLSGFHGFDFVVESGTSKAHLIEMNPRATQVGHLALGPGRDLPAALYAAVSGKPVNPAPQVTGKDTIALFPQEWIRDASSPFLSCSYHDVPWQEPELLSACVLSHQKQKAWYAPALGSQTSDGLPACLPKESPSAIAISMTTVGRQ